MKIVNYSLRLKNQYDWLGSARIFLRKEVASWLAIHVWFEVCEKEGNDEGSFYAFVNVIQDVVTGELQ